MADEQVPVAPGSAGETQNEPSLDELPESDDAGALDGRRTPESDADVAAEGEREG